MPLMEAPEVVMGDEQIVEIEKNLQEAYNAPLVDNEEEDF
jgi:hypothetical protein